MKCEGLLDEQPFFVRRVLRTHFNQARKKCETHLLFVNVDSLQGITVMTVTITSVTTVVPVTVPDATPGQLSWPA